MKLNRKSLTVIGFIALFILSYLFFLYRSFPYEPLVQQLTSNLPNMRIQIGSVKPKLLPGMTITDLVVREKGSEDEDPLVQAEEIGIRVKLLSILTGNLGFDFEAKIFGGNIDGSYTQSSSGETLSFNAESLKMVKIAAIQPEFGLPLHGSLNIGGKISLGKKGWQQATGEININAKSVHLEGGEIMGFKIPILNAGTLEGLIEVTRGKLKINELITSGGDLLATIEAESQLRTTKKRSAPRRRRGKVKDDKEKKPETKSGPALFDVAGIGSSSLHGTVKFKLTDAFIDKNAIVSLALGNLGIEKAKKNDGYYHYRLTGRLDQPGFRAIR